MQLFEVERPLTVNKTLWGTRAPRPGSMTASTTKLVFQVYCMQDMITIGTAQQTSGNADV